ncbi:MAG: aminopeptidase [Eubacteriales bacterium]|nr:aminopeptidase [Eubacteriales bacterium]
MDNQKQKLGAQDLLWENRNLWALRPNKSEIMDFCEAYKLALNRGKTERKYIELTLEELRAAGFVELDSLESVKAGDKVYKTVEGKGLFAAVAGTQDARHGLRIVGAHVDSPRLDLKPNPLYEDKEISYFKTHYYGGIKKYQWAAIPLALVGVVYLKDGSKVDLSIGLDPADPVFTISDLLPHLGKDQMERKARETLRGEELNIIVGSMPFAAEEGLKDAYKLQVLHLLNEKYGIVERDLLSAEIEVVPATEARCVGLDRSFVGGYGQDDRVCAYTAIQALLAAKAGEKSFAVFLFDKEEVGSDGVTGAQSERYRFILNDFLHKSLGRNPEIVESQEMIINTELLSSDVTVAFDPVFSDVTEPLNSTYCGKGIGIAKYTGSGGKGGTSDCSAEFTNRITRLFDQAGVAWQMGELGKVDQGGGGTIAKFFANQGMQVLDCGVPTLSMHSCFELCSKVDIFESYKAYLAFFNAE